MVTINLIVNLLVEKTIAFGGVEIGIIKAQLAAKTIGKSNLITLISEAMAKAANKGNKRNVVAVLLVNSVIIDVKKVRSKIIIKISKFFIKYICSEIVLAKPVSETKKAIESPPPNNIKIFHGTFLYQSKPRMVLNFLSIGIIKKNNEQNITILASLRLILKREFR